MLRLIVFDLDGTLIDSRRDLANATNRLLAESGAAPLPDADILAMVGEGAAILVRRALAAAALDVDPAAALARFLEIYDACLLDHTRAYPGIPAALEALHGTVGLAVLTNKPEGAARRILAGLDLGRYFGDAVIGGDSRFPRKPDPSALLHLAARADAAPEAALMVGDSRVDLETARRAGTPVCLAKYGFGYRFDAADLTGAEYIIASPGALVPLVHTLGAG